MENIIQSYAEKISFLKFTVLKNLIVTFCKKRVAIKFKRIALKKNIDDLNVNLMENSLPPDILKRHKKLLRADLKPELFLDTSRIVINLEIAALQVKVDELNTSLTILQAEMFSDLQNYLDLANFKPLPNDGDIWDVFWEAHLLPLMRDICTQCTLTYVHTQKFHLKKIAEKKLKLEQVKEKKREPLVLTEDMFEKLYISVSKKHNTTKSPANTSKSSVDRVRPQHKKVNPKKKYTVKKQGNAKHPQESREDAGQRKRASASTAKQGKPSFKKSRN